MKVANLVGFVVPTILASMLAITADAHENGRAVCLNKSEAAEIVSRWTSIAVKINITVVNETVTDDFTFYSDSQDFLEGLPVRPQENLQLSHLVMLITGFSTALRQLLKRPLSTVNRT
jgi:hypothetical protein